MMNELYEVMTFSEASQIWGLADSTLRMAVRSKRIIEGVDYRKSANIWLIAKKTMVNLYGEPKNK